jgi:hypothetical protein
MQPQLFILIMNIALVPIALLAHFRVHDVQNVVARGEDGDLVDELFLSFVGVGEYRPGWRHRWDTR